VDAELCVAFGVPVHEKEWFHGWYNYIGFSLAMGCDWEKIKSNIAAIIAEEPANAEKVAYWQKMEAIRTWLELGFTFDAWAEIGKR